MTLRKSIITLFVGLFVACANPGTPTGGERDEDPPKITSVSPDNYSVKFNKNRVAIVFDEFVCFKKRANFSTAKESTKSNATRAQYCRGFPRYTTPEYDLRY